MKLLPIVDIVSKAGEITLQPPVTLHAGTAAQYRVHIAAGQKLSGAYNKVDQGGGPEPISATLAIENGPVVGFYTGRDTGTAQRFASISDGGESGSYNGDPAVAYILTVWANDQKKDHKLVLGWGNGNK